MGTRFLLVLLSVFLIFSIGCGRKTSKVAAPSGGSGASVTQTKFTAKDMRAAIIAGCAETGWRAADAGANTMEATIIVRDRHAVLVSIPYTASDYSINYKDSDNMGYRDRGDGTFAINTRYNNWVRRLNESIQKQISLKQAGK